MFLKIYTRIYNFLSDIVKTVLIVVPFIVSSMIAISIIKSTQLGFIIETLILLILPTIVPFLVLKWFCHVFSFLRPRPVIKKRRRCNQQ